MKLKFIIFFCVLIMFSSCNKNNEELIVFDDTYPLLLAPDVEWAVVNDPYAAYRKDSDWNAELSGHCRKGDILQVKGKSRDNNKNIWFLFENGWLPSSCLSIYSNRLKAKDSSQKLIDKN